MADQSILDRLPTPEDLEREIARKICQQRLLQIIRNAVKRERET